MDADNINLNSSSKKEIYIVNESNTLINMYFPDELFTKIFSYLEAEDLGSVSLVCKLWNRIASDKNLWQIMFYKRWQKMPTDPENAKKMFIREFYRILKLKQNTSIPYTIKINREKKFAYFIPPNYDSSDFKIIRSGPNCARFQRKMRPGDNAPIIKDGKISRFNWKGFVKPERGDEIDAAYAVSTTEYSCRREYAVQNI